MMVKKSTLPFVAIVVVLFFTGQAGADLVNGDFSETEGWESSEDSTTPSNLVAISSGQASLTTGGDGGPALISLYQRLKIPADAFLLEFDVAFSSTGTDNSGDSGHTFFDFFQVSYLDGSDDSLDTYFVDIDAMGPYDPKTFFSLPFSLNSMDWYNFSFDISNLRGHTGTLYFDLWDGYDGIISQVLIDNVAITPVPEPATMMLFACGLAGLIGFSRRRK